MHAIEPTQMYLAGFSEVFGIARCGGLPGVTVLFVIVSQVKINVTNAYAGSLAWSNFFARLTHSHPGRVVWLVFNVLIAMLLMTLGVFGALERVLGSVQQCRHRLGGGPGGRPGHQQAPGPGPPMLASSSSGPTCMTSTRWASAPRCWRGLWPSCAYMGMLGANGSPGRLSSRWRWPWWPSPTSWPGGRKGRYYLAREAADRPGAPGQIVQVQGVREPV